MHTDIAGYIEKAPFQSREKLLELYELISRAIHGYEEVISYQIPCFKKDGKRILYFAGWKNHVSIYPIPEGDARFKDAIKDYVAGRGTLRFSLDKPLPKQIIKDTVKYRLKESGF